MALGIRDGNAESLSREWYEDLAESKEEAELMFAKDEAMRTASADVEVSRQAAMAEMALKNAADQMNNLASKFE